jgi:glycerol-3-phosphate dehydrogenase
MNRTEILRRVEERTKPWQMIIVGGGATGVGVAIDAASRGYEALLLEQSDFGKGTSSRSTKLIHGGIRYLRQGNLKLVTEALKERTLLLRNAPHIVRELGFVIPYYKRWEGPLYGSGLKLYEWLAGRWSEGNLHAAATRLSSRLSSAETVERLPKINRAGLRGGSIYYDAQFDDSRLLVHMVMTAFEQGASVLNYAEVTGLTKDSQGCVNGVFARDAETGNEFRAFADVVINATGAFSDGLRRHADSAAPRMIAPSQGIHLVFDGSFLAGQSAMLIPRTSDGRVLFAIPWYGHTLVGTTETPLAAATLEPIAFEQEVELILSTMARYFAKAPTRDDVLSVFAGVRPLVRASGVANAAVLSRNLARDHIVQIDRSKLVTVCGGKWTTYRRMAEDCVDQAAKIAKLPQHLCRTHDLPLHGFEEATPRSDDLAVYGSDAREIQKLIRDDPRLGARFHLELPYLRAEVVWAVRSEMARTIEDVLARRTRALFLNARVAVEAAPEVCALMAQELGWDQAACGLRLGEFRATAANYMLPKRDESN